MARNARAARSSGRAAWGMWNTAVVTPVGISVPPWPVLRPLGNGLVAGGVLAVLIALLLIYVGAVGLAGGAGGKRPVPPAPGPAPETTGPPTVVSRR